MLEKRSIVGVLLAAGQSTRFGSNKCLQKLSNGNEIALQSALNLSKQLDQVICIIPPNSQELKSLFERNGFQILENELSKKEGMSSSIKLAVEETKEAQAWLFCLADMPNIKSTSYQSLISKLDQKQTIVIPKFNQKRGNPVGLSNHYYQQIMLLEGDVGAKQIFKKNSSNIIFVEVDDEGVLQDIDTVADYNSLKNI
ncbi:MAG: molybdenum cofactor cytidylyltransferase [Cocleimonas sp.]